MAFNPNGNNWVNSDSMGKQLLMKAGWSKGEGIGKHKQGTNVHIKVSIKNEKDGIGLKSQKRQSDLSLMQCFTFDNILKSKYGKTDTNSDEIDELNQRGLSRARYGRAVPQDFYKPVESEELNRILCKSKLEKKEEINKEISNINEFNESNLNGNANFISSYTVFEYFSMKMKNSNINIKSFSGFRFQKSDFLQNCDENSRKRKIVDENESISEANVKKKKKSEKLESNDLISENLSEKITKKKKKSKKNKENNEEEPVELFCDNQSICDKTEEINSELIENPNRKKKKRKVELIDVNINKESEREILSENKEKKKKCKKEKKLEMEIDSKTDTKNDISPKKIINSVTSVEIIDNKKFCPWDSCNISTIEGYKYY